MSGDSLIGRTLGERFTITSFIGEGAMASVYRGTQSGDPGDVALKVAQLLRLRDRAVLAECRLRTTEGVDSIGLSGLRRRLRVGRRGEHLRRHRYRFAAAGRSLQPLLAE